jgi:diamine N-acetyltransferase
MDDVVTHRSVLRPMTAADLDALLPVQREAAQVAFAMVYPQDEFPFPTDAIRQRWERELADPDIACFVILDSEREVAGFAAIHGAQFLHFGTALRQWGTGLAGAAYSEVLRHWRAHGHRRAWLRVLEDNVRARRFYERRGWQPTGERERSAFAPFPVLLRYDVELDPA